MSLLIVTSLIVAFIAGMAALFAPCCITVLLPSYLASIFREKYKVMIMTSVFFLGILTVFLPIGLGVSALAQLFKTYHTGIFLGGGIFLLVLGGLILAKKSFSLPFHVSPKLKNHNASSVYVLGIFSGIATTCCAPVLAGALALSVLPGSLFWGGMYTVMYVLGMVAPLFFIAAFLDKFNFTQKIMTARKPVQFKIAGRAITRTLSELVSGTLFAAMGGLIIYLAFTDNLTVHADYQTSINIYFAQLSDAIRAFLVSVPPFAWLFFGGAALLLIIWRIIKLFSSYEPR